MRDITIGQYYPAASVIHSLDPRTKLMGTLIYIIGLFLMKDTVWYLGFLAIVLILYRIAHVPFSYFLKGLRNIIILIVMTFLLRMLCTPGEEIFSLWIFGVTREGIYKAIHLTSRISLMIVGASLLSYTSTPRELSDGLEKAFRPLEKIRIPIGDMAVMTMIAFRFIPVMLEEANSIMDAQASRGVEFHDTSVWKKCRNMFSVAFPLFMNSIRRSADLAMAMDARGFSPDGRSSRMNPLHYSRGDIIGYVLIAALLLASILIHTLLG